MSIHNIYFHDRIRRFSKRSLNTCFLIPKYLFYWKFPRNSENELESAMVNYPSVFESLNF